MDLQSFSSIFELFATFALAYIVIDELTENPFLATMTEKILRKYHIIDNTYAVVRKDIEGKKISLSEIEQWNINDENIKNDLPIVSKKLISTSERCERSFSEIRAIIQSNYSTKVFGYLNCYLFFYCLTLLFYGGVYSSNMWYETDLRVGAVFRARIDTSLALFTLFSFLFIASGWWFDKNRAENQKFGIIEHIYRGEFFNGYVFSFLVCIVGCILGMTSFFLRWSFVPKDSEFWHNVIMVTCILIPVLNFITYIIKGSWRANKCLPRINELATTFNNDYQTELKDVQTFITTCGYFQSKKVDVESKEMP